MGCVGGKEIINRMLQARSSFAHNTTASKFIPSIFKDPADVFPSSRAGAGGAVADVVGVGAASAKMSVWLHGGYMVVACRLREGYMRVM